MNSDEAQRDEKNAPAETSGRSQFRYRPLIILLFAVILLCVSSIAKSQEPQPIPIVDEPVAETVIVGQAFENYVAPIEDLPTESTSITGNVIASEWMPGNAIGQVVTQASFEAAEARRQQLVRFSQSRPKYAEVSATLSNFDADAEPDGWRAQVVLRDSKDRPVVMRSRANFELTPRIPTADFHSYVDATESPIRWSLEVDFDEDGIARFKLPLREKLRPAFGWNSATYAGPTSKSRSRSSGLFRRANNSHRFSSTTVFGDLAATSLRSSLGRPMVGELRVRVSVPTEGVFEAATAVSLRPPGLVDTAWPYR